VGGEGFARFDEPTQRWVNVELGVQVDEYGSVHFACGEQGPIVAVSDGEACTLLEFTGRTWAKRGSAPGSLIARGPDGSLYCSEDGVHLLRPNRTKWVRFAEVGEIGALAWGVGTLLASNGSVPLRLDGEGVPEVLLSDDRFGEQAAYPLAVSADRIAYARGPNVYVFDAQGEGTQWFGAPPDDALSVANAAAKKAFKKPHQRTVKFFGKDLRAFPSALLEANQLEELDLGQNKLVELPADIGRLRSLRWLNLHLNCISSLPKSFEQLTALEHLDLGMNTSLQTLEVRGAKPLREVPPQLRALSNLKHLVLSMNELADLPDWLAELPLETLDISSNRFARAPKVLTKLTRLKHLALGQQPWTSGVTAFPAPFSRSSQRAPDGLDLVCRLTSLETLEIDRLDLPELPRDLGQLTQLKTLRMGFNSFTTLPESFFNLRSLTTLTAEYVKLPAPTLKKLRARLPNCTLRE
jgi:hypothetical protein